MYFATINGCVINDKLNKFLIKMIWMNFTTINGCVINDRLNKFLIKMITNASEFHNN